MEIRVETTLLRSLDEIPLLRNLGSNQLAILLWFFLLAPPGSSWLLLAAGCSPLTPPGSSKLLCWLLLAPASSSWLLQAPPGSSRLLLAHGFSWLLPAPPSSSGLIWVHLKCLLAWPIETTVALVIFCACTRLSAVLGKGNTLWTVRFSASTDHFLPSSPTAAHEHGG